MKNTRLQYHWKRIKIQAEPRWQHFATFCEDIGEIPYNHSIVKFDTTKPYGPTNFTFNPLTGNKSQRTLRYKNRTQTINEWAKETGLSADCIRGRLRLGWTITQTLETK